MRNPFRHRHRFSCPIRGGIPESFGIEYNPDGSTKATFHVERCRCGETRNKYVGGLYLPHATFVAENQ